MAAPLSELFTHLVDSWFLKQQKKAEKDLKQGKVSHCAVALTQSGLPAV
jgi:hypothetical protein